jgi:hypothetical protein
MIRPSNTIFAALLFAVSSSAALPASKEGWTGTWAGAWGGKESESTSVTVEGKKVVSYTYQGTAHPVAASNVTPSKIVYEDQGITVTLIKKSETTASASLHSDQGDATATLTRQ